MSTELSAFSTAQHSELDLHHIVFISPQKKLLKVRVITFIEKMVKLRSIVAKCLLVPPRRELEGTIEHKTILPFSDIHLTCYSGA